MTVMATPMLNTPFPIKAAIIAASRRPGKAYTESIINTIMRSIHPPRYPETRPMGNPTLRAIMTPIAMISSDVRAPHTARLSTSLPALSVPIRCCGLGG